MSTGGEVRKPWRARKTMAVSNRSQMEALKKAKGGGGGGGGGGGTGAALVAVAPKGPSGAEGPEANPFLDASSLQDLLCRWYKDEAQHPLCPSLEVQPEVPPPAGEAPVFAKVTEVGEAALGNTIQDVHQRKKRPRLEEGKEAFPKPLRPSDAGAERSDTRESEVTKVKGFIQEQLAISMEALDHRIQDLDKRIDRTQCLRKHEGISIKIVKRISRLDKHLNRAITILSSKIKGSHSQNQPPNGGTKSKATPSKEPPSNPREISRKATEQLDDVVCLDEVSQDSTMQAVNPTDVGQKETSANVDVSAAAPRSSQNLFVIDLTEEENKLRKDKEAKRHSTEQSRTLNPPQPLLEASNQGPGDFSRLPPLPKARLHPGPAERFQGTLPPQKLTLAVASLERPKGTALRWGVLDPDPRCATVESFHLFLCQEEGGTGGSRRGTLSAWRETHCIPAVSLSMACSLADFPPSTWCYFAMRARDVYGREGPFSEIRSVFTT